MQDPPLDAASLRRQVCRAGGWRTLEVTDATGSTNTDLAARSRGGEDIAGAVLIAEYQTAGRGRHNRSWSAPRRTQVTLSVGVGLPPAGREVDASALGWLPLAAGVAVVDAVGEAAGVECRLKWPNDVVVAHRKLAGILCEVADGAVVLGVGLNTHLRPDALPDPNATSLVMLGAPVDRMSMTVILLRHLARRTAQWRCGGGAEVADDYRARCDTVGRWVRADLPGASTFRGHASGIDELGRLLVRTPDGVTAVSAGDVVHLRSAEP